MTWRVYSQLRVRSSEEAIERGREAYRPIALRASVCFDTAQYLREVNPLYQFSFAQFLTIYDAAIAHSDRASVKTVVERLTWSAYTNGVRMLHERDRAIYQLLLALEVCYHERACLLVRRYSSICGSVCLILLDLA